MNLYSAIRQRSAAAPLGFQDFVDYFTFNGMSYGLNQTLTGDHEEIGEDFISLARGALKANGIVFAVVGVRMMIFSEARFQYRRMTSGRPGDLFGDESLLPLEKPWSGGTTGNLLSRMEVDNSLSGNAFVVRRGKGVKRLRPDWVTILLGSPDDADVDAWDIDSEVLGYLYHPGGHNSGRLPVPLLANEVAHYAPWPDPLASYRGMSWLSPVITDILGDKAMASHKIKFLENGATPNVIVKLDVKNIDDLKTWIELFRDKYEGNLNAYKTMFLGAGADATVVGSNFKEIDFKSTQGAGETRIAAAGGVPPTIVGLSEGLQGSTLNAGNYAMARRRLADGTMRPLWREAAGSLSQIIRVPKGAELWYDDRDIAFLREDIADAAKTLNEQATAINTLVTAGYTPDSARDAIIAGDLKLLKHSGAYSVQLQKPGAKPPGAASALVAAGYTPRSVEAALRADDMTLLRLRPAA